MSQQVYQWVNKATGGHEIGRHAEVECHCEDTNPVVEAIESSGLALMKTWPSGRLMLVPDDELRPYPSSPIPQP